MARTFIFLTLLLQVAYSAGQVRLPRLLSDGAILQRGEELTLWGWASPGEDIDLELQGHHYAAVADRQGNWELVIPPQEAGGPHDIVIRGNNEVVLHDILFGEVWVCSGQSNMELTMERTKDTYPDIVASYSNPKIRQFLVPDQYDFREEHTDLDGGSWTEVKPSTIFEFSAVGFFFARQLQEQYNVPVGLINAALGGSPIEAWMSEETLKQFPDAYAEHLKFKSDSLIASIEQEARERQHDWYGKLEQGDKGLEKGSEWYLENIDDGDWETMQIPGFWADEALGFMNGAVWFRRNIEVPGSMAGKEAKLWMGRIVDQDFVYVNGILVGTTGYQYPPRKYTVPAGVLKPGTNTVAIRVVNQAGQGGFIRDKPYFLAAGTDTVDLSGTWKYRAGVKMPFLRGGPAIRWKPGGLYNRMIAPLQRTRIKGVIWYQGESNASRAEQYCDALPALIRDWRAHWNQGDFPFIYVQLANYMEETPEPSESDWAELRQAQLSTLSLPNTGMAVIIDIGEWNDIHPLNKLDVGKRLAWQAMTLAYGAPRESVPLCPVPEYAKFGKKNVEIGFRDTGGKLITRDGDLPRYFELSEDGKTYVRAVARIKGDRVIVRNEEIASPVAVRYAWANNPAAANLVSREGLPASPFRFLKDGKKTDRK